MLYIVRAPTADVGYVPNAKYLAHIPHQTQFKPIYQMWYIVFFFPTLNSTVTNLPRYGRDVGKFLFIVYFFLPLSPSVSSLSPNPLLSSLSRPRPRPRPRQRRRPRRQSFPRQRRRRSLSSNGFSVFFFFFLLWFDGFGSDGGGWVRMG